MDTMLLIAGLVISISQSALGLPIELVTVSNFFTNGTESQIAPSATLQASGRFHSLKTGSTYAANRFDMASSLLDSYFFFRPALKAPVRQGVVKDSSIIMAYHNLMLEAKIHLVVSEFKSQPKRRLTMFYDAVSDMYAQISMTN